MLQTESVRQALSPAFGPGVDSWTVIQGSLHPASRAQAEAASALGLDVRGVQDAPARSQGLIIFGGDTALAVFAALGIRQLTPLGEIFPGVAVSSASGRIFVTKAGGYGQPGLVADLLRRWKA